MDNSDAQDRAKVEVNLGGASTPPTGRFWPAGLTEALNEANRQPCPREAAARRYGDREGTQRPPRPTASHWAIQKAASAWCSDRTEHKVMDRELCEAFAEILDQVRGEFTYDKPAAIAVHQPDYKEGEWKHMSFIELGTWVDQLVKRAARRSNDAKREKDLYDAGNYLAMLKHKFEDAKTALGF